MSDLVISAYGSHNGSIAMLYKGKYYVVEVERWANIKNSGLLYYNPIQYPQTVFDEICEWLLSHTDGEEVDAFLIGYMDAIKPKFKAAVKRTYDHHTAHAASAFYQSPYDEMLIFTFDGGGDGAFFNVYTANRTDGIQLKQKYKQDLGFPYMLLAETLSDIKRETLSTGNLVYAGKLMGLCAYGNVREEWIDHFNKFYERFSYDGESYIGGTQVMKDALVDLFKGIGVEYEYMISRYGGQVAWDIAATSQKAFENMFFKLADTHLNAHPNLPVGMSGGCALNVLLNTTLALRRSGNVYVPPNTNDCGMASGGLLWYTRPEKQVDLTYSGLPIMDEYMMANYVNQFELNMCDNVTTKELAGYIAEGNIVGVINGNSEHGSRALGNRSILCSPSVGMKDKINLKVKNREWYRPFAPVVRLEDVSTYFDFKYESRHMTYAAPVKQEWRDALPAITHEDGTGRLQTVTREQNALLYDIISEYQSITELGVLLNTSFNVNGKPILTTLADAFSLLHSSKLDAVFFKHKLFFKKQEHHSFESIRKSRGYNIIPLDPAKNEPTVCLVHCGEPDEKIINDIKLIRERGSHVTFIGTPAACTFVERHHPTIKTFEVGRDKWFHYERLSQHIEEHEIPSRLKLLWARLALSSAFKMVNNVTVIDYTNKSDINSILKSIEYTEQTFFSNSVAISHDNDIYNIGFGSISSTSDDFIALTLLTETVMIESFSTNTPTLPESAIISEQVLKFNNREIYG